QFAAMLACRARLQIAGQHYDKAIHSLQTGMAMSRHLGDSPLLISSLVGVASANLMLKEVEELIQAPHSLNLYLALVQLPVPFIDIHKAIEGEDLTLFGTFPLLRDIETTRFGPDQQKVLEEQFKRMLQLLENSSAGGAEKHVQALAIVM